MTDKSKVVPKEWQLVMDTKGIDEAVSRMAHEIVEKDRDLKNLAIVGIRTGGEYLARRLEEKISGVEGKKVAYGVIDITLYRDDLSQGNTQPVLRGTDLQFRIAGTRIILVDDVLYTGRTIRAALNAIIDFGRPRRVELAALVDRGHRELPIQADYIGKTIQTKREQLVRLKLSEQGFEDGVYLIDSVNK